MNDLETAIVRVIHQHSALRGEKAHAIARDIVSLVNVKLQGAYTIGALDAIECRVQSTTGIIEEAKRLYGGNV